LQVKGNAEYWSRAYDHARALLPREININDDREWKIFQMASVLFGIGYKDKELGKEVIYADEDTTPQSIYYTHGIMTGDMNRTVGYSGNFSWLLAFATRIASMYGKEQASKTIDDVTIRLKYGISKKLVPLCNLRNVGKERAKALFKTGYCDVESIARASPSDLANVDVNGTKLGYKIATSIVDSAAKRLGKKKATFKQSLL